VPQKADGTDAGCSLRRPVIGDKVWGGSLPCGSGHALLRRGAAEPLRVSALRVSIVAAEPVESGGRSFEPLSLRWEDLHPTFHYRPTVLGALKDKPYRARKCASLTAPPRGRNGSASQVGAIWLQNKKKLERVARALDTTTRHQRTISATRGVTGTKQYGSGLASAAGIRDAAAHSIASPRGPDVGKPQPERAIATRLVTTSTPACTRVDRYRDKCVYYPHTASAYNSVSASKPSD
jgi:hypothetical protein